MKKKKKKNLIYKSCYLEQLLINKIKINVIYKSNIQVAMPT